MKLYWRYKKDDGKWSFKPAETYEVSTGAYIVTAVKGLTREVEE
jgi:hypothetical protein